MSKTVKNTKAINKFEWEGTVRSDVGKGASRRLRHTGRVPAIIYGAGKEPLMIDLAHHKVLQHLQHEAVFSHILTLNLGNESEQVVLKALQRHPYKPAVMHIDFLRIKTDEELVMHVPLHFVGEDIAPGIKLGGGVIQHYLTNVEIKCLPKYLPEYIELDVSKLELDNILHLSDVKLPEGVTFSNDLSTEEGNSPVIGIHIPRVIKEEVGQPVAPTEGEETAAEGEDAEKSEKGKGDKAEKTEKKAEKGGSKKEEKK